MKDIEGNKQRKFETPGTLVLVFIFLAAFATLYVIDWLLLTLAWPVR